VIHREVYSDDGTDKGSLPYTVSVHSYHVRLMQPRRPNQHAVSLTCPGETIDYHYERKITDPRISHTLTLEVQ
jgi:hypothetical protein